MSRNIESENVYVLREDKTSKLRKLLAKEILTQEQFDTLVAFFRSHTNYENRIDWNRVESTRNPLSWADFEAVMAEADNSRSAEIRRVHTGISGITEGVDYKFLGSGTFEGEEWTAYQPLTHLGSRTLQDKKVPPIHRSKDSAGWCIGWTINSSYWDKYKRQGCKFVILCGKSIPTFKVCLQIYPNGYITIWDYWDKYDGSSNEIKFERDLPEEIVGICRQVYNEAKAHFSDQIKKAATLLSLATKVEKLRVTNSYAGDDRNQSLDRTACRIVYQWADIDDRNFRRKYMVHFWNGIWGDNPPPSNPVITVNFSAKERVSNSHDLTIVSKYCYYKMSEEQRALIKKLCPDKPETFLTKLNFLRLSTSIHTELKDIENLKTCIQENETLTDIDLFILDKLDTMSGRDMARFVSDYEAEQRRAANPQPQAAPAQASPAAPSSAATPINVDPEIFNAARALWDCGRVGTNMASIRSALQRRGSDASYEEIRGWLRKLDEAGLVKYENEFITLITPERWNAISNLFRPYAYVTAKSLEAKQNPRSATVANSPVLKDILKAIKDGHGTATRSALTDILVRRYSPRSAMSYFTYLANAGIIMSSRISSSRDTIHAGPNFGLYYNIYVDPEANISDLQHPYFIGSTPL